MIGLEALGVGLGAAASGAFIARATHPGYTATQHALFTSLAVVPRTFANAATGWLVDTLGWMGFSSCARRWRFPACCCSSRSHRGGANNHLVI